jgi:hypothetical protein
MNTSNEDPHDEPLLEKHVRYHEDMPWFAAFHLDATDQLHAGSAFAVFLVRLVSRGACA